MDLGGGLDSFRERNQKLLLSKLYLFQFKNKKNKKIMKFN